MSTHTHTVDYGAGAEQCVRARMTPIDRRHFVDDVCSFFKYTYMTWMSAPKCSVCVDAPVCVSGEGACACSLHTRTAGHRSPTAAELALGVGTVEMYACAQCARPEKFARHRDVTQLLRTRYANFSQFEFSSKCLRTGRCGEYSQLFAAILQAYGFDMRLTFDLADHIWNEWYEPATATWIHCDSCEASVDQPLLYESGLSAVLSTDVGSNKL